MENKKEIYVKIKGMHCASCSLLIEKTLTSEEGIIDTKVNLLTESSYITYDPTKINTEKIYNIINQLGYKAIKDNINDKNIKGKWSRFKITSILAIILLYIAMAPMFPILNLLYPEAIDPIQHPKINAIIQVLMTLAIVFINKEFYTSGIKAIIKKSPNMYTLVSIGTLSALIYSLYSTFLILDTNIIHHLYYETVGIIITLILLGKNLEETSKSKTSIAIKKLLNLSPKTATIIRDKKEIFVDIKEIKANDIVIVKPGEKIPVDGKIIYGLTSIDESIITGESIPVEKKIGDKVIGGTINKNGYIKFIAEKVGKDTFLSQMISLIENSLLIKPHIARLADKVAGYFVPIVVMISLISAIIWYTVYQDIEFSIKILMSVLLISCPCALGLATPTALILSIGKAAENGILIKNPESLETLSKVDTIIFDKTGTLTIGKPVLTDIISLDSNYNERYILQIAASIEKKSEHPLSDAIVKKANEEKIEFLEVENFYARPGYGIYGTIQGKKIIIGNKVLNEIKKGIDKENLEKYLSEKDGKTIIYVIIDENIIGIIKCKDVLKPNASEVISKIKEKSIKTIMITGDNDITARVIGKEAGVDEIISEVLPEEKLNKIKEIMNKGKIVTMIGDGINDAPSLAYANVGIAIGSGTDIAIESGDIVLIHSNLNDLLKTINLSKETIKVIKQNLFWAFFYNIILIPIAAGILKVFSGPELNPIFATIAMSLSSISVVTNALRLKRKNIN